MSMAQNEERTMLKRKSKIVSFRASVHDESCATKKILSSISFDW